MSYIPLVSDSGNRSNGSLIGSTPDNAGGGTLSTTWAGDSGFAISSNKIVNAVASAQFAYPTGASAVDKQRASITVSGSDTFVCVRLDPGTGNCYVFGRDPGSPSGHLYIRISGGFYSFAGTGTCPDGTVLTLEADGSTLNCYYDGVLVHPDSDSTFATGVPGIIQSGDGTFSADDFLAEVWSAGAVPTKLGITTPPAGNASGTAFTTQPVIAVQDSGGSTVTTDTSTVTATLNTISGSGTLGGTTSKAAVSGVATFTNLAVTGAGSFTITFSDGLLTPVTTSTFYVGATQLAIFTQPPASVWSREVHASVVVELRDAGGSRVSSSTASVTIAPTKTSGVGSLFGRYGTVGTVTKNAVAGRATFDDLSIECSDTNRVTTTGTYTATSGVLASATTNAMAGKVRGRTIVNVSSGGFLGTHIPAFDADLHVPLIMDGWEYSTLADAITAGWRVLNLPETNSGTTQDYTTDAINGANSTQAGSRTGGSGSYFGRCKFDGIPNDGGGSESHLWSRDTGSTIAGKDGHTIFVRQWIRINEHPGYPLEEGYPTTGSYNRIQLKWLELTAPQGGGDRAQFSSSYGTPKVGYDSPWPGGAGGATYWGFLGHQGQEHVVNGYLAQQTAPPFFYSYKNQWALHEHVYRSNSKNVGTADVHYKVANATFYGYGQEQDPGFVEGCRIVPVGLPSGREYIITNIVPFSGPFGPSFHATATRASSNTGVTVPYYTIEGGYIEASAGSTLEIVTSQSQAGEYMAIGFQYLQIPTFSKSWNPFTITAFDGDSHIEAVSGSFDALTHELSNQEISTRRDGLAEMHVNGMPIVRVGAAYVGVPDPHGLVKTDASGNTFGIPTCCEIEDLNGMYSNLHVPHMTWYANAAGPQIPFTADIDDVQIYCIG